MGVVPERPAVAGPYRAVLAYCERHLRLPRLNPSWWTLAGLLASVACLYTTESPVATGLLVGFALLADWLDGATARVLGRLSREGYLVDNVADRYSEGFIFLAALGLGWVGIAFFALWLVNCALTIRSATSARHRILPLRAAYLVLLILHVLLPGGVL